MVLYLNHVAHSWKTILRCNDRMLPLSTVDSDTVQNLELLAPKHSQIDKDLVCDLMERKVLFASLSDTGTRQELLDNLCAFSGSIPSLRTFFDMLKYIEPTCEALRKLLDTRLKTTIRSSLKGLFWAPAQSYVQATENDDVIIETDLGEEDRFMVAYAELWAFCSRHFDGLTASTPLKETTGIKPCAKGPNPVTWYHLARFATSRGFRVPNAHTLLEKGKECYHELALEYLRKAHPTRSHFSSHQIHKVILDDQTSVTCDPDVEIPLLDIEFLCRGRRNGRPFENEFAKEKLVLFIPRLFSLELCSEVTLTYMRRELYSRLFLYNVQVSVLLSVLSR
jgi:hypothetical protein